MDPSERYRRTTGIFLEVCELPPAERAAALERACGEDRELQEAVEALLRYHDAASGRAAGGPDAP